MANIPVWQEVDSKVHRAGLWPAIVMGLIFAVAGVGLIAIGCRFPPVVRPGLEHCSREHSLYSAVLSWFGP